MDTKKMAQLQSPQRRIKRVKKIEYELNAEGGEENKQQCINFILTFTDSINEYARVKKMEN